MKKKENTSEEEKNVTSSRVSKGGIAQEGNSKKSKNDDESDDPQLQEFLQVMQHRSKSKMWANDTVTAVSLEQGNAAPATKKSDGDLAVVNGEVKNLLEKEEADQTKFLVNDEISDQDYIKSRIKNNWSDSDSSEDEDSADGNDPSDSDDHQNKIHHDPVENTLEPDVFDGEAEDGSNEVNDLADPSTSPKNKNDEDLESGRLFIRNLPYTCT